MRPRGEGPARPPRTEPLGRRAVRFRFLEADPPEVSAAVREGMVDVVRNGTARRLGSLTAVDGALLTIGGKTGTGDDRQHVYAAGGRLVESRVMNRTATFTFLAGDRHLGVTVACLRGRDAGNFAFISTLPVRVLRILEPRPQALAASTPAREVP